MKHSGAPLGHIVGADDAGMNVPVAGFALLAAKRLIEWSWAPVYVAAITAKVREEFE
jgi:hypothetical protein